MQLSRLAPQRPGTAPPYGDSLGFAAIYP